MKVLSLLPLAFAASALVIPDTDTIESLTIQDQERPSHPFWKNIKNPSKVWEELEEHFNSAAGQAKNKFDHAVEYVQDTVVHYSDDLQTAFAGQAWLESPQHEPEHPPHGHHPPPHHGKPHDHEPKKTVWEIIEGGKRFSKFAAVIKEFPDLVERLNGTSANFTVFVPTNCAFKHIPEDAPKPPKAFVEKLLAYHISPEFYPAGRILVSRTIPTALEAEFIGGNPQRLSTQLGLFGLTVNFYARIVHVDRFGSNGVIHALDSFLLPPPKVVDIISILPGTFSTLELGLYKTELYELFNNTHLHEGGTLFAPTNFAFELLGPRTTAYLFSPYGLKYLRSLLLYHAAPDVTLYTDAIYKAKKEESSTDIPKDFFHIDLPTGLHGKSLSIDAVRFGRLIELKINGFVIPTAVDGIAADGVIHTVPVVLIPPREAGAAGEVFQKDMTLEELKERLEPYVQADHWEL